MKDKNDPSGALLQELARLTDSGQSVEETRQKLSAYLNKLINDDFEKLVQLLYRLDIDESKLKRALQDHQQHHTGELIADMIIERQLQKIKSRKEFNQRDNNIDENEKW